MQSKTSGDEQKETVRIKCVCNTKDVAWYCKTDKDVICSDCKAIKHRNCLVTSVDEECTLFDAVLADITLADAGRLGTTIKEQQEKGSQMQHTLNNQTETCREPITKYSALLKSKIDNIETNSLQDLETVRGSIAEDLQQLLSTCSVASDKLKFFINNINRSKPASDVRSVFIWHVQLSKLLLDLNPVLKDFRKKKHSPNVVFERDESILQCQKESLGHVNDASNTEEVNNLADLSIQSIKRFHVSFPGDT